MLRLRLARARVFAGSLDDPALAGWTCLEPTLRDVEERPRSAAPARFFERRAVARHLAAETLGVDVATVAMGHDARGAPCLLPLAEWPGGGPGRCEAGWHISISARGDVFAIALSPNPAGIDIEPAGFDLRDIPWNILHPAEQARLRGLQAADVAQAFLEVWTAKEACLKATGAGLLDPPEALCIVPRQAGTFAVEGGGRDWRGLLGETRRLRISGQDFILSVAVFFP